MQKSKELPTHYNELRDKIKSISLEKMFKQLEEFQKQKAMGFLDEDEQFRMKTLERCIELRLDFELHLEGFTVSDNTVSESSGGNIICLKHDELKVIENFLLTCKKATSFPFLLSKHNLN